MLWRGLSVAASVRRAFVAVAVLAVAGVARADVPKRIHVFVALADNVHQGIVPVPKKLGNGADPANNLYWGAAYGVKTYFKRHKAWTLVPTDPAPSANVLERVRFVHTTTKTSLVADAYRGEAIKSAIEDFLAAAAGGEDDLVVYVGHDGLMDFALESLPTKTDERVRDAMVLACISKSFFKKPLEATGARPLLWTTGLMAPEAYSLADAIDGWIAGEPPLAIRDRAAKAYHEHQKCGVKAAQRLFATGW